MGTECAGWEWAVEIEEGVLLPRGVLEDDQKGFLGMGVDRDQDFSHVGWGLKRLERRVC